ncbi:MAG: FG-GAP repeat protein, partial [Wenzhouxiangella sp.]|nr:FG-GAP repeat protein [Wenzhouxiangella sp.]
MSSNPFFPSRQPGPSLHVLFIVLALCGAQAGFVEPAFAERSTHSVLTQSGYLKASNTGLGDEFGSSVAASGGTIIVGAEWEDSAAIGVDGNQLDDSAANAGAAYIFERSAIGRWSQQAYLKASNTEGGDRFGHAVALSDNLAAVGAFSEDSAAPGIDGDELDNSLPDAGAVYVFVRDSAGTWTQDAYIKASSPDENDQFGMALAISGNTLVVGVAGEDSGSSGINGDPFDNSLQEAGAVYVFVRDEEGSWTQQAYIKASNPDEFDNFGASVAIDGDLLVVGAKFEDGSASGVDANQSDNSASNAGAAYVFVRNEEGQWSQQAYLKPSNTDAGDQFGFSVAASGDTVL